jgi:transcriptional regulator with XRE-family HTH domain
MDVISWLSYIGSRPDGLEAQKELIMGRRIDEVIAKLPKQRRDRIAKKANVMAREMIAHADSLGMVRKALRKTQTQIGEGLGLPQNAVSQLESRSDLLLSTLRRYVNALGADLDLIVRMKDGSQVVLKGLGDVVKNAAQGGFAMARRRTAKRSKVRLPR